MVTPESGNCWGCKCGGGISKYSLISQSPRIFYSSWNPIDHTLLVVSVFLLYHLTRYSSTCYGGGCNFKVSSYLSSLRIWQYFHSSRNHPFKHWLYTMWHYLSFEWFNLVWSTNLVFLKYLKFLALLLKCTWWDSNPRVLRHGGLNPTP